MTQVTFIMKEVQNNNSTEHDSYSNNSSTSFVMLLGQRSRLKPKPFVVFEVA